MLKKENHKIKRVLIRIACLFTLAGLAVYVVLNIHQVLNPLPASFPITNKTSTSRTNMFYGETIDMSQILPTSQHYVVNSKGKDLIDIAADLGINLIRITNGMWSFNNNADSIYTADQWNHVLDKMQSKGIKAIILIEVASHNPDYYARDIRPAYLSLVQKYIASGAFSHPAVYAVDIKNEPVLTDANVSVLQTAHAMIRAKYPHLKQTVGWWATYQSPSDADNPNLPSSALNWSDASAGQKLDNIVDFYCYHMYGFDFNNFALQSPYLQTKALVSQFENGLQTNKPILIEEFGGPNGDAVTELDIIGSPELQAKIYQGVYQALQEMQSGQLIGTVAFDFYGRNPYPDGWAIVKDHGDYLFPAAHILQMYALRKDTSSLQALTTVNSQGYLARNADNNSTVTLHLSDRIGLELRLDQHQNYSVSLSANGILKSVALFHYEYISDAYYAVYQAASKGSVQINIIPDFACSTGTVCASPVYTLTINIQ